MARMRGLLADVIRGSIGGLTFTANQFHQIVVRQRTSPVNPNTNAQAQIRGAMSNASVVYNLLSAADKQRWQDYADTIRYPNPLGPIDVPGRQVCVGNVGTVGYLLDRFVHLGPATGEPPVLPGFVSIHNLAFAPLAGAGTGYQIEVSTAETEGIRIFALRSFAFGDARLRYKGPFLTSTITGLTLPGPGSGIIEFTGLLEDSIYFTVVRATSLQPPYRLSAQHFVRAIATTTP